MVRNSRISIRFGIRPNFVATSALSIKFKAKALEAFNDFPIFEAC